MSSTKRTPDEPGSGSVATGPHAESTGNGTAANGTGNGRPGEPPSAPPSAGDGGAAEAVVTGSDIAASGRGAPVPSGSGKAAGAGKAATPDGEASTTPPSEAATAQFRVPVDGARPDPGAVAGSSGSRPEGGSPAGPAAGAVAAPAGSGPGPAAPGPGPVRTAPEVAPTAPVSGAPRPPVPPTLDPVPAPAVPAPGPAAAQPPPWRRMAAHDGGRPDSALSPADRLLDEGPTAFLEAPRFAQSGPSAAAGDAPTDTGSWARIPRSRPPRQAALQLKRLDPWSVLKLALVLAVVLFFIWLVAVGVLYGVLDGMGVWDRLNGTYADLVSGESPTGNTLISAGRVFGLAAVVGAINSLLFAVAVTVGAFVYNVSADLVGGIEVTLSERD